MAFIQTLKGKTGPIYKVHYKEPLSGKRRCKNFSRMKAAQNFRDNIPKSDYLHDSDTVTVAEAADKWLDVCKNIGRKGREPVEKSTLKPYQLHAGYIKEMIGNVKLNQLDPHTCERFKNELLSKFDSRSYARKILTSFKGILSEARTQGWLKSDPAENVRIVLSERNQPQHRDWLSLDEVKAILKQCDERAASTNKQMSKRWQRYRTFIYPGLFMM